MSVTELLKKITYAHKSGVHRRINARAVGRVNRRLRDTQHGSATAAAGQDCWTDNWTEVGQQPLQMA